jgi:hypothetical protein
MMTEQAITAFLQGLEDGYASNLLTIENAKTTKGEELGYLTGILYLAPYTESVAYGGGNLCSMASEGCASACLFTAGRGRFDSVKLARIRKTIYFYRHREQFMNDVRASIKKIIRKAKKLGLIPAIRLNGTSDFPFHKTGIMQEFPDVQFYDYTKVVNRIFEKLPSNYHLTFSRSESNQLNVEKVLNQSLVNIAAVFNSKDFPTEYFGRKVINGDEHDLRFLDEKNCVVALKAKGKAKKDTSGFVIHI